VGRRVADFVLRLRRREHERATKYMASPFLRDCGLA